MSSRESAGAGRPGFTLVETMVGLVASVLLIGAMAAVVIAVSHLERLTADRADVVAAGALAGTVVAQELRVLDARSDGFAIGRDSAALRAFRGSAIVCTVDSTAAEVRYRGLRAPDPAKDSLLVLAGAGVERAQPLDGVGVGASSCLTRPGETAITLKPGTGMSAGDVVLVFERGSYHLISGALRYRRGASGRQPLTADIFLDDSSDFNPVIGRTATGIAPETTAVRLRTAGMTRSGTGTVRPMVHYVPLLNIPVPLDSVPGS